jgi:zinc transport system substrate-binding protein
MVIMIPVLKDVLRSRSVRALMLVILVLAFSASGCAGDGDSSSERTVVAAFYPLAWAVERIVDDSTRVVSLTPSGVEPHDIELSPRDVETVREADFVVYLSGGFQPAVEEAVAQRVGPSLDVLDADSDPHIWLDPPAFAAVFEKLARELDAARAAGKLVLELRRLDSEYRAGLRRCERRTLVTTHAAFGRLAERYGLDQLALAGRSPEAEPSPRELEELIEKVRASGATTVFAEPLVSDDVAETVAREAGISVSTLDPVEGLSEERLAAGEDYLSIMRSNLAALREALGCR